MSSSSRLAGRALSIFFALVLALVGSASYASAAPASTTPTTTPTWELRDIYEQHLCLLHQDNSDRVVGTYTVGIVTGTWSTDITFGLRNLPHGVTSADGRLAPGSNHTRPDGSTTVNLWFGIQYPVSTPVGSYEIEVWASDGTVTQTVPAEIRFYEGTSIDWVACMNGD